MASRAATKALRTSTAKQLILPVVQRRTLTNALNVARPLTAAAPRAAFARAVHQKRGMKTIDFAGHKETVYGAFETCCQEIPPV